MRSCVDHRLVYFGQFLQRWAEGTEVQTVPCKFKVVSIANLPLGIFVPVQTELCNRGKELGY